MFKVASKIHQFILALIVRKMKSEGYEIIAYDGNYSKIENMALRIPFTIIRHRPDLIGISLDKSKICIGEAKTNSDLRSDRTKEEFVDFASIGDVIGKNIKLIIGVPKNSNLILFKIIKELKLQNNKNIEFLIVPEELFSDG